MQEVTVVIVKWESLTIWPTDYIANKWLLSILLRFFLKSLIPHTFNVHSTQFYFFIVLKYPILEYSIKGQACYSQKFNKTNVCTH